MSAPPIQLTYFKNRFCLLIIHNFNINTDRPHNGNSSWIVLMVLPLSEMGDKTKKRSIVRYPFARWIMASTDALIALTSCRPLMKLVAARTIPRLAIVMERFVNINILYPVDTSQYPSLNKIGEDPYIGQNQRHYDIDIRPG